MADALALANAAAPAAAAAAAANGRGAAGAQATAADGSFEARLQRVERIAVAHERTIHCLEDRCTYVVFLKSEQIQTEVLRIRDIWKARDEETRADRDARRAPDGAFIPHPLGSQRALMHAAIFKEMSARVPADRVNEKRAAELLRNLPGREVDQTVHRLKPKHYNPAEGRTWVWQILLSEGVPAPYRAALTTLTAWRHADIGLAQQRSQDGPIIKAIQQLTVGKGKGKGGRAPKGKGRGGPAEGAPAAGQPADAIVPVAAAAAAPNPDANGRRVRPRPPGAAGDQEMQS